MKPKNKYLLPKKNKYLHKEILDITTPTFRTRIVPTSPYILTIALFLILLGFVLFWIPLINPLTMGLLSSKLVWRFG